MVKRIVVRFEEDGIIRTFDVFVKPGMSSLDILAHWKLNEYFFEDPVTKLVCPRQSELFPFISQGQILQTIHESLVDI